MAVTKSTNPKKKQAKRPALPPKPKLTSDLRDYAELKVYVENGCCLLRDDTGRSIRSLSPTEIAEKFPQFQQYDYSSRNSVIQRFKGQAEKQRQERADAGHVKTHRKFGC